MIVSSGAQPTQPFRPARPAPRLPMKEIPMPNLSFSLGAALTFHVLLFAWNPVIISASQMQAPPELRVRFEKLPSLLRLDHVDSA